MQELLVPKTKPASPDTWEIRQDLTAAQLETGRIPIDFPEPYLIVGAYTAVISTTNEPDLRDPTPDDILTLVDLNNQRLFTSTNDIGQTTASARDSQFVTLGALDTRFRDLHIRLMSPRPILGISFRWKILDQAVREALYQDCIISVSVFCTPFREQQGG